MDSDGLIQILIVRDDPVEEFLVLELANNKLINRVDILHDIPTILALAPTQSKP